MQLPPQRPLCNRMSFSNVKNGKEVMVAMIIFPGQTDR